MTLVQLLADDMRGDKPPVEPLAGCCIAGGAVRRWFTGDESLSDVDVFSADDESEEKFVASLVGFEVIATSNNATTMSNGKVLVQCIKLRFKTTAEMFDAFDFSICQFAWNMDGIWTTPKALIGTLRKHLSVHKIQPGFEMDSLRRAFKYQRKGFTPCLGALRDLATSLARLEPPEINAQVEISPQGGKRIIRYD